MTDSRNLVNPAMLVLTFVAGATVLGGWWWAQTAPPSEPVSQPVVTERETVSPQWFPKPAVRSSDYVGSQTCAECHSDVFEAFSQHPMRRSMHAITDDPIEDYHNQPGFSVAPSPHYHHDYRYEIRRSGEEVVHCEIAVDRKSSDILYEQAVPIHFAVGSGERGRSYLTNRDGVLLMSPVTWYSQRKRWDLSPGYELQNRHFGRRIVDGCLQCHAGRTAADDASSHLFKKEPFHELEIGCERCHGPGQQHTDFWLENHTSSQEDPFAVATHLQSAERDQVCFQCHLIGESRVPRYGRTDFDFRPGDHVTDIWVTFVKGDGVSKNSGTDAVSQVGQMLSSRCYTESAGELGCTSCHDPHQVPAEELKHDFYRDRCLNCHQDGQIQCSESLQTRNSIQPADSCVTCHMPALRATDVPHTSLTDHRVLRRPADAAHSGGRNRPVLEVYGADDGRLPEAEIERATGIQMVLTAESSSRAVLAVEAIPLLQRWLRNAPDDLPALEALGTACFLTDDFRLAEETLLQGLAIAPRDERFLRRLFVLFHESGQMERAIEFGKQVIEVNPWDFEYHGRLAHVLGQTGRFEEGIQAAENALRISPSAFRIHGWLSEVYQARGNAGKAEHHRQQYESLRPSP